MNADIDSFQRWWKTLIAFPYVEKRPNIVILWQREIPGSHFFFGKVNIMELNPFLAEDLSEYYCDRFGSAEPFTPEALLLVASLSRGVFRRFKMYLQICLDNMWDDSIQIISESLIHNWLSFQRLEAHWEKELMQLFPKSANKRRQAIEVLKMLIEKEPRYQKEVRFLLFGSEDKENMSCSRVLTKLEQHQYIKTEYEGRKKLLRLRDKWV